MSSKYLDQGYKYGPFYNSGTGSYDFSGSVTNTGPSFDMGVGSGGFQGGQVPGQQSSAYTNGPGYGNFPEAGGGGVPGWLQSILGFGGKALDFMGFGGGMGKGAQNLGTMALMYYMMDQNASDRKAHQQFQQQLFDTAQGGLGKAEDIFDSKAPMREGGMEALLQALGMMPTNAADHFKQSASGQRAAGQYL